MNIISKPIPFALARNTILALTFFFFLSKWAYSQTNVNHYKFRTLISINNDSIAGAQDMVDFPVLLKTTKNFLKHVSLGGKVENGKGYDIAFALNPYNCGDSLLFREIETYDSATGEIEVWVKLDTLFANKPNQFYLFCGNPSINQPNPRDSLTWNSNYLAVHHLGENLSNSVNPNRFNGVPCSGTICGTQNCPTQTTNGLVGNCQQFGFGKFVSFGNMNLSDNGSLQAWVNLNSYPTGNPGIVSKRGGSDSQTALQIGLSFLGKARTAIREVPGSLRIFDSVDSIQLNSWSQIVGVMDNKCISTYLNGEGDSCKSILGAYTDGTHY